LRYIREQQEKKYKSLFEENLSNHSKKRDIEPILSELDTMSEIEDTIHHFNALDKQIKSKNEKLQHNHTIRNNIVSDSQFYKNYMGNNQPINNNQTINNHPPINNNQPINNHPPINNNQPINNHPPINNRHTIQRSYPPTISLPNIKNQIQYNNIEPYIPMKYVAPPHPGYGCLKHGKLKTYKTQRNYAAYNNTQLQSPNPTNSIEKLKEISRIKQMHNIIEKTNQKIPETLKYIKRKKTLKRTFFIGKSKVHPKIGVLIPNKTIRKNIMTKAHLLKQTPLSDMRKYLIKRGFMKVGSSAPKDVIAKMYESAILVGGEINNHNPENLLYNYFNAEKE
jgi:hypothetical protein